MDLDMKGKLKEVCKFYRSTVKSINPYHYGVQIKDVTSKKIVVECHNQFNATAYVSWNMTYVYKKGKWKRKGSTYKVDYSSIFHSNSWTANRKIKTFKLAGSKKKSFTIKKGEKIKIEKICLKNKKTYFQVRNKKAKKGWFADPKDFISFCDALGNWHSGYFEEAMFAG